MVVVAQKLKNDSWERIMTGVKVKLIKDFSVVRETLTRIGIINHKKNIVVPSCYCLPTTTENIYAISHFKELFPYFGRETTYSKDDELRRDTIVFLLKNWDFIEIIDGDDLNFMEEKVHVLPYEDKPDYEIRQLYEIFDIVSDLNNRKI